ncbi:Six-hairpin glycosidase [Basidiobolus meristosporus CBS 931.73]|uniref:Endoglucanase n=1 Tax=Basidiobolus meristosporus CBS 931.73 TaxID=1314790 RepID=A0A1Y1YBM2_9FUNG|nr:Six-hairpin glycosidase [Basidiobolus meristosporus CBS 931.73]|eukprot:ORX95387.1 Six-hairpin glycosidase [Basidiobolus meristosporus CBS 931.73]
MKLLNFASATILLSLCSSQLVRSRRVFQLDEQESPKNGTPQDPRITPPGPLASPNYVAPEKPKYDYSEVLHKSQIFYHTQRSGKLPYQRLAWRSDSCFECKGKYGEDLSGAWYEAANTMKWSQPLGYTIMQLAFNILAFGDAMEAVNEKNEAMENLKWGTDYLINAHPAPLAFVAQLGTSAVGKTDVDFGYFGPPEFYEQYVPMGIMHTAFYVTPENPSSEILGIASAAMSATAMVFKDSNPDYAKTLLDHAAQLYHFGTAYPGTFMKSNDTNWTTVKEWYPSTEWRDELALAAIFLYQATNNQTYLDEGIKWYNAATNAGTEWSWDDQGAACHILLYHITKQDVYKTNAQRFFDAWLPGEKQTVKQTPRGLSFYEKWGSLSYAANTAFAMIYHARDLGYNDPYSKRLLNHATQQMNYILGDCGRSWVVGFGQDYPQRPYHKGSYNSYIDYPLRGQPQAKVGDDFLNSMTKNRFILYGALVGGPDNDDTFFDDRTNYVYTEVTQDYNAAFQGSLAGLIDWYGHSNFHAFSDCNLDLGWSHANVTGKPPQYAEDDCYHTCNTNCAKKAGTATAVGDKAAGKAPSAANSLAHGGLVLGAVVGLSVLSSIY